MCSSSFRVCVCLGDYLAYLIPFLYCIHGSAGKGTEGRGGKSSLAFIFFFFFFGMAFLSQRCLTGMIECLPVCGIMA